MKKAGVIGLRDFIGKSYLPGYTQIVPGQGLVGEPGLEDSGTPLPPFPPIRKSPPNLDDPDLSV